MTHAPKTKTTAAQAPQAPQQKPKLQPQKGKAKPKKEEKPEVKPSDPEMIVIPLEEMEQQPQTQQKSKVSS